MTHYNRIANLIYLYAHLVDAGDFEALGVLFEKGSIFYMPSTFQVKGGRNVTDHFSRTVKVYPETGTPCTLHQVTNVSIECPEGEGVASSNSVFTVYQFAEGQPMQLICAGRYYDRFILENTTWYFQERSVVPHYFGDLSRHILDSEPLLRPVVG